MRPLHAPCTTCSRAPCGGWRAGCKPWNYQHQLIGLLLLLLLRRFFSDQFNKLVEGKDFFVGPPPQLLSAISADELTVLLSGSDRRSLQAGVLAACLPPSFQ